MRAIETLLVASDLKTKLSHTDFRQVHANHLCADPRFEKVTDHARGLVDSLESLLNNSSMYFVKGEMTDLITYASERLEESDVLDFTLAPTQDGFVYFEKPIPLMDLRGTTLHINMALWHFTHKDDLVVFMWNDQYRTPDPIANQIKDEAQKDKKSQLFLECIGRWGFIGMVAAGDGQTVGQKLVEQDEETIKSYEDREGFTPVASGNFVRAIHAYWLLMNQTLVNVSEEQGDKRVARTMKQMKLPNLVNVIQYRRTENDREYLGESNVQWSHRWIVRGHWRWQPFKNEKGQDDRKRIWIAPFMKGPEDKPLVLTDKIYALTR